MTGGIIIDECGRSDGNRYAFSSFETAETWHGFLRERLHRGDGISKSLGGKNHLYRQRKTELIKAGENADALAYELADMEKAINGDPSCMHLDYTKDVMDMMTEFRKSWGFTYPEEENKFPTVITEKQKFPKGCTVV